MSAFSHLLSLLQVSVLLLFLCPAGSMRAEERVIVGDVVSVLDGDTIDVMTAQLTEIRIRLAEVDAPEHDQPFAREARSRLAALVAGRRVRVVVQTTDKHDRLVGRVYQNTIDVCAELVKAGSAWAYRQYLRDATLLSLEAEAKAIGRGLWASADPVPPWEWRRGRRGSMRGDVHCDIKGNINAEGRRLYHLPGMRYYERTRIDEARGERWFCSEAAATAAGWVKARE
ncbi:MAG: thermonuclease family protein [Pseudomonadales bacterium]|nr:thermonuclease family protein [Pseudomonadales bacterium]MCP5183747.1 thermonuclease family protein [Pseudomonadales bacterium]